MIDTIVHSAIAVGIILGGGFLLGNTLFWIGNWHVQRLIRKDQNDA